MSQCDDVLEYIKSHPMQCDDCIAERLGYPQRQMAGIYARHHRDAGTITRIKGQCSLCKSERKFVNIPASE